MSGQQFAFENLTFNDFNNQLNTNKGGGDIGDSAATFANIFYGSANSNNISFDFNITNYSLLLDNLSRAFNMSPENLSHYINDTIFTKRESGLHGEALTIVTVITVFYSIIFISGIIGNLITCIVISRNKYMHTATNFYLFNLAISDLLLLTSGLPQEIYSLWNPRSYPFSDFVCILESTLLETAANVTVLTITAFSVERYIAICHPFRQHSMSKLSRAIKFIMAIWITAFVLALPQAMQFAVIVDQGSTCTLKNLFYGHVFAVSGCVFFVGPMTAICVLYVLIGRKLKKSKLLQGVKRYDKGISAQTRVIRMLIAVAVAFFLCWAPFHAQRLMAVYGSTQTHTTELFNKAYHILNHVSGVMYYLSTCINPLLYNIMSHKFRNAFKLTLARQCGVYRQHQAQNNNYYCAIPRQQNSSMRLGNMSGLDHHRSNTMQLNKRESGLSLLHDNNMNSSNRTSVRSGSINNHYRCVSVSSQSTLMTTLGKNDVYSTVANVTPNRNHHHHIINNTTAYCNSNSSSFSSKTNRPINNSTSSTGNNCSPTCTPDDLQISSIDDNLDELADCHRLKNVQRYQNPVTFYLNNSHHNKNQQHCNNQDQYVTDNSNSDNENYNTQHQHQQQPQSTVTILNDQSGKSATTVSVILPAAATTKKLKSSGSNGSGFRKSFESHPNSMMALNNGIPLNQTASLIINSNVEKEILTNDQNSDDNYHHHHPFNQQDDKKNKKEYNNAINNTISKISKNEIIYNRENSLTTSDDIILSGNTSSNLSNSCSSNSNSSNLYNKCYKLSSSSSSSSSSASLSSIQKTILNNELPEMNNISIINCDRINQQQSIKSINDPINRIQNILSDNTNSNCNLTKSNSFNNTNTNLTNSHVKNDLNHRNLKKNSTLEQQQSKMILPIATVTKSTIESLAENSSKNSVKLNNEPAQI